LLSSSVFHTTAEGAKQRHSRTHFFPQEGSKGVPALQVQSRLR
jgi:hypothetical protein